jgi:thiol-disulfide isomerase/thioredoxin
MKKNIIMAVGLVALGSLAFTLLTGLKDTNTADEMAASKMETPKTEEEKMTATKEEDTTAEMAATNPENPAPAFELMDLAGNAVSLESLKGEPVYLKFWASWCSICLAGLEELNTLAGMDEGFKVITIVSPDFNGEKSSDEFIKWFSGLEYKNITVLLDTKGAVVKEYGVRGYPTSVYIDAEGGLVKQLPGHTDNATIKATFKSME